MCSPFLLLLKHDLDFKNWSQKYTKTDDSSYIIDGNITDAVIKANDLVVKAAINYSHPI
jgi:hypothetical protein